MNAIPRRSLLLAGLGAAGTGTLTACTTSGAGTTTPSTGPSGSGTPALVSPFDAVVAETEKQRHNSGTVRNVKLTATAGMVDLGGRMVKTWTFGGQLPGPQIRVTKGDTLIADLANHLSAPTSVHWHGVALRNDMDGVPPVTQRAVPAGGSFTYRFICDAPGTYWFHPHVGVQLDRGLYGPLIVEDPHEPLSYDDEWVVVLDDWLDGVTGTPDEALAELSHGMGGMNGMSGMGRVGQSSGTGTPGSTSMGDMGGMDMGGMDMGGSASASPSSGGMSMKFALMGATSRLLGGDAGDVKYPYHLVGGRLATAPAVYRARPGARVRLRIVNAGGDTPYRVALGGHKLTITHTDGFPVQHQQVDALLVGMGERYDVLVTLGDGVFPLVALAEGKNATGMAVVRTGSGSAPRAAVRPKELDGMITTASELRATDDVRLASKKTERVHRIELTGGMNTYDWAINGKRFDMSNPTANPIVVEKGQRVRLDFVNTTTMWHPMHLHGHTYQCGSSGPRKDTTIVLPKKTVSVFFDADNPGQWMLHCHNAYHGGAGMMALVAYQS